MLVVGGLNRAIVAAGSLPAGAGAASGTAGDLGVGPVAGVARWTAAEDGISRYRDDSE